MLLKKYDKKWQNMHILKYRFDFSLKNTIKCAFFSCIFIFWNKHLLIKNKIYWRCIQQIASKYFLNYSSFLWNPWSWYMMSRFDFFSVWVYPNPPKYVTKVRNTYMSIKWYILFKWHQPSVFLEHENIL